MISGPSGGLPLRHLHMTDDTPTSISEPGSIQGPRGTDDRDPLTLFPTETEVEAARRAQAPAKREGDLAQAAPEADSPRPRRRVRGWFVVLVAVLAGAAVCVAAWWTYPGLADEVGARVLRAVSDPPSTLLVETTPAGWEVVEGSRVLGTTPLTIALPPGTHALLLRRGTTTRPLEVTLPRGAQVVHHLDMVETPAAPTQGGLQVTSVPAGAAVALDGTLRGAAPLLLTHLAPGDHTVVVANAYRTVSQRVTVAAGETATLLIALGQASPPPAAAPPAAAAAPPAPAPAVGWVTVSAGIELQVYEGNSLVGSSRNQRITLTPGSHTLRLVNTTLGFETTSAVTVKPGEVGTVSVQVPNGSLSVNAEPWAEVLLDGTVIGETPIANLAVAPGQHQLVFRNPLYPEQRRTVLISLSSPTRVGVDLRQ